MIYTIELSYMHEFKFTDEKDAMSFAKLAKKGNNEIIVRITIKTEEEERKELEENE